MSESTYTFPRVIALRRKKKLSLILYVIIWNIHQLVDHCLIPLDPSLRCDKLLLKLEIIIFQVNVKDVKEETKFQSVMIKRLGKGAVPFTLKVIQLKRQFPSKCIVEH